jgi:ribosome modulation factor
MTQLVNPYSIDNKLDRAAHEGYKAAIAGQTIAPAEYAGNDELKFSWTVGNRRARYDAKEA